MARPVNRSALKQLTISLPAQTHAYLVRMAKVGARAQTEQAIAAQIVVIAVEELMDRKRAARRYLAERW